MKLAQAIREPPVILGGTEEGTGSRTSNPAVAPTVVRILLEESIDKVDKEMLFTPPTLTSVEIPRMIPILQAPTTKPRTEAVQLELLTAVDNSEITNSNSKLPLEQLLKVKTLQLAIAQPNRASLSKTAQWWPLSA